MSESRCEGSAVKGIFRRAELCSDDMEVNEEEKPQVGDGCCGVNEATGEATIENRVVMSFIERTIV